MPGISGAARLAKSAATSKATKSAVKKLAKSELTKTAVSAVVLDSAVPAVKDRIEQRLSPESEEQEENKGEGDSVADLGAWNEPTRLGLQNPAYERYLKAQIQVIGEYEEHLESYESPAFDTHADTFYQKCEHPELQQRALSLLVESAESFITHLEQFAVRDDAFREYVMQAPESIETADSVSFSGGARREQLEAAQDHLDSCTDYISYLVAYTEQDPEFDAHASSYGEFIEGTTSDLETIVVAGIQYLAYLEKYAEQESEYRDHVERFSPEGEAYYTLVEAENELLKNAGGDGRRRE